MCVCNSLLRLPAGHPASPFQALAYWILALLWEMSTNFMYSNYEANENINWGAMTWLWGASTEQVGVPQLTG